MLRREKKKQKRGLRQWFRLQFLKVCQERPHTDSDFGAKACRKGRRKQRGDLGEVHSRLEDQSVSRPWGGLLQAHLKSIEGTAGLERGWGAGSAGRGVGGQGECSEPAVIRSVVLTLSEL